MRTFLSHFGKPRDTAAAMINLHLILDTNPAGKSKSNSGTVRGEAEPNLHHKVLNFVTFDWSCGFLLSLFIGRWGAYVGLRAQGLCVCLLWTVEM